MKTGKAIKKVITGGDEDDPKYNVSKKGGTNQSIATKQRMIWDRYKKDFAGDPEGWAKKKKELQKKFKPGLMSN
jgi:hypothetical protein